MIKIYIKFLLAIFFACSAHTSLLAQSVSLGWAKGLGGAGFYSTGYSIASASSGNVYVAGFFEGAMDGNAGVPLLSCNGGFDIFVAKYDAGGQLLWIKNIGGADYEYFGSIALDASENVYLTGFFSGTVDFDPGSAASDLTAAGGTSMFCLKLDAAGSFVWVRPIEGNVSAPVAHAITVSPLGNVHIVGNFDGDAAFGNHSLTSVGGQNIFICKIDGNGNFLWARQLIKQDGDPYDVASSVQVDAAENVYTTGYFSGTTDFDPGTASAPLTTALRGRPEATDIFIAKLNANGDYVWAKAVGGDNADQGFGITFDPQGNVYATGCFRDSADFDPGPGITKLVSNGNGYTTDIYVIKLTSSGDLVWVKGITSALSGPIFGANSGIGYAIRADASGSVYFTGSVLGILDFDPGPGYFPLNPCFPLSNPSDYEAQTSPAGIFAAKLDTGGDFQWARLFHNPFFGTSNPSFEGRDLALGNNGAVFVTGSFVDSIDFDPGPDTSMLRGAGTSDVFVLKLGQGDCNTPTYVFDTLVTACNTVNLGGYTLSGPGYKDTGTFIVPVAGPGGCDSIVTLYLISNQLAPPDTIAETACDSFVLAGHRYSSSGRYNQILQNTQGCDSIRIFMNLTVKKSTSGPDLTETACDSLVLGERVYKQSGTYIHAFSGAQGCDSFVRLNITISQSPVATVSRDGRTLIASPADASYQWINCDDGSPVVAATKQSFTSNLNGRYAVVVMQNSCSDTSECITNTTGITEAILDKTINIYPNPATNSVTIISELDFDRADITLTNLMGQELLHWDNISGTRPSFNIVSIAPGFYVMEIMEAGKKAKLKFIKQ